MLRIHLMQQWYALSDPAMEEALYEIASMRRFARLSLVRRTTPDETTIVTVAHALLDGDEDVAFADAGY